MGRIPFEMDPAAVPRLNICFAGMSCLNRLLLNIHGDITSTVMYSSKAQNMVGLYYSG